MKLSVSKIFTLTAIYFLIGIVWILFSDKAILAISNNVNAVTVLQTLKGWFFVATTSIVLYTIMKKMDSDVSAAQSEYEILFSTIRDGLVFVHFDGTIIAGNSAFIQTFSPANTNIAGLDYRSLINVTWQNGEEEALIEQLMVRGFTDIYKKTATLKNGCKISFEVQSYRVQYNKEPVLCSIIRDVSHSETLMTELVKAKNKAEESDRLKAAFLQNMSHEIRTPMNGIVGFSEMLKSPDLPAEKKTLFIDTILKSSNQLLNIVNDILDISKIETGQTVICEKECNINHIIDYLYTTYHCEAEERNVELVAVKTKNDEEATLIADENKLKQIFGNIISNAFKFAPNGTVRFGYRITSADVLFFVADEGPGIPKHDQDKIFDRFDKGEVNLLKDYGGTGLGLAICKGTVELMKGAIWVESELNEGAHFYFSIPYKTPMPAPEKQLALKSANILVVEDEEINYHYIKEVFKNQNITVERAKNGLQAVEKIRNKEKYDLILMDIRMPAMDGYQATKRIREIDAEVPIIAQTAFVMNENKYDALKAGCNDYIGKPIKQTELLMLVEKYIKTKKEIISSV